MLIKTNSQTNCLRSLRKKIDAVCIYVCSRCSYSISYLDIFFVRVCVYHRTTTLNLLNLSLWKITSSVFNSHILLGTIGMLYPPISLLKCVRESLIHPYNGISRLTQWKADFHRPILSILNSKLSSPQYFWDQQHSIAGCQLSPATFYGCFIVAQEHHKRWFIKTQINPIYVYKRILKLFKE